MTQESIPSRQPRATPQSAADDTKPVVELVPQRERRVDFYGDEIPVAQLTDGTLYVALRPITDFLGLAFSARCRRVLRHEILAERVRTVLVTAADGRRRDQLCLPLDPLPGWLFGVSPGRARPELMEKLRRYRADCFRVLWQAFAGEVSGIAEATRAVVPAPSADASALEHIAQMAEAIAIMARQQLAFEQHVDARLTTLDTHITALAESQDALTGRLDQAAAVVGGLLGRVGSIEETPALPRLQLPQHPRRQLRRRDAPATRVPGTAGTRGLPAAP